MTESPRVALLDLAAQYESIRPDVDAAIARVMASQQFILGPEVEALEREIAAYCGAAHGVAVSSGTDALLACWMALGVGPGHEVITTPFTFVATAMSIVRAGATPVFVDIDPATFNLDVNLVRGAMTPATRAVLPVHVFGQMTGTDTLQCLCDDRGVFLVEDAAQAIGAEWRGRRAGAASTAACYSFFPSKNLGGAGDGGMVVTDDSELAGHLRRVRNHGQQPKYFSVELGGNFRLDALQAAIVRAKLPHLDGWNGARRKNAATYRALFSDAGFDPANKEVGPDSPVVLPVESDGATHVYNQFVIRSASRDALRERLSKAGIQTEVYYPHCLHDQPFMPRRSGDALALRHAERAAREVLALPIHPHLDLDRQALVVAAIRDFHRSDDRT